jgi:hypothetical protein
MQTLPLRSGHYTNWCLTNLGINRATHKNSPFSPMEVVRLLCGLLKKSCNTLPLLAGGSGAVATGEGYSRSQNRRCRPTAKPLSGPDGPTLPEGE